MEEFKDFLGNPIKKEMRCVRSHGYGHHHSLKKSTVVEIDPSKKYTPIGILTDGNMRIGWTYPDRIIVETSFKDKI